jgi:hypothetical protein
VQHVPGVTEVQTPGTNRQKNITIGTLWDHYDSKLYETFTYWIIDYSNVDILVTN